MSHSSSELREKLDGALTEVGAAEEALDELLKNLRSAPRAEKVTVTEVVETAFARLKTARAELAKMREIVDEL
jgi:hypothetical protein